MTTTREIGDSKYAVLTTFRKDGSGVGTPIWIMPVGAGLGVWTGRNTGKVRRIRRNPAVTLATCDMRGRNVGVAVAGRAEIVNGDEVAGIRAALRAKYGRLAWLYVRFTERGGRSINMAYLRISLDS